MMQQSIAQRVKAGQCRKEILLNILFIFLSLSGFLLKKGELWYSCHQTHCPRVNHDAAMHQRPPLTIDSHNRPHLIRPCPLTLENSPPCYCCCPCFTLSPYSSVDFSLQPCCCQPWLPRLRKSIPYNLPATQDNRSLASAPPISGGPLQEEAVIPATPEQQLLQQRLEHAELRR